MKTSMQKSLTNYAFIDSQNLNLAIHGCGWVLDFQRFRVYLKDKYKISKAFLFIGYVAGNERLYTRLQEWRFHKYFAYIANLRQKLEKQKRGSNLRTKP